MDEQMNDEWMNQWENKLTHPAESWYSVFMAKGAKLPLTSYKKQTLAAFS